MNFKKCECRHVEGIREEVEEKVFQAKETEHMKALKGRVIHNLPTWGRGAEEHRKSWGPQCEMCRPYQGF